MPKKPSQPLLFGPTRDRVKPRVMMHVCDAGEGLACFLCAKCGHQTDWVEVASVTEGRRGMPCPECNGLTEGEDHV